MKFFLWTDQEKSEKCFACKATISMNSHGYSFQGRYLCVPCHDNFWDESGTAINDHCLSLMDRFSSTVSNREGEKAD